MEPFISTEPRKRPVNRAQKVGFTYGTIKARVSLSGKLGDDSPELADVLNGNVSIVAHTEVIRQLNDLLADPSSASSPDDTLEAGAKYEMKKQLLIGGKRVAVCLTLTLTCPAAISRLNFIAAGALDDLHLYLVNSISPASAAKMQEMMAGEPTKEDDGPGEYTGFYL